MPRPFILPLLVGLFAIATLSGFIYLLGYIDKKNNTLLNTKYFEQYNESWLLLIDEGKAWSAFSNDKPKDFILKSEWKFDKVFVFCLFDYSYQQLM